MYMPWHRQHFDKQDWGLGAWCNGVVKVMLKRNITLQSLLRELKCAAMGFADRENTVAMIPTWSHDLQAGQKGVLIRRIEPTAPANKVLKKGDILLSFDGIDIANDGTVPFRSGERISFNYLVSKKYTSEQVELLYILS